MGRAGCCLLWQVAPLRPLFANGTARGIFTGDEMGCGGAKVSTANYSAILKELRTLVGPGVLLYANDCVHDLGSSLHPKNDSKPSCCRPVSVNGSCDFEREVALPCHVLTHWRAMAATYMRACSTPRLSTRHARAIVSTSSPCQRSST